MSKLDAQRAMREAKYARLKETVAPTRRGTPPPVAPPSAPAARPARSKADADATADDGPDRPEAPATDGERLCGHQSISGRTCTREHGHSQKSHRYS